MASEVTLFEDFDAVARDAGAALSRERQPWLFDRLDWFRLVQKHTPEGKLLVLRARNAAGRCWLFLSTRGRYAAALSNWYCLRFGTVVDGSPDSAPVGDVARGLRQAGITHLYVEPIGADDPLPAVLRRRGWATRISRTNVSWRIDTDGMTFEQYWASRPSRLRNTARRRAQKVPLDIVVHRSFDAEAWQDYESVYEASWKPSEGSPALVREMAEQEDKADALRLGLAYHEGRPIAGQVWTVENGVATIHKLAYREDAKALSPGTLLSMEMFRLALDVDKVRMIDFGIGDHPYKREWMTHFEPLYGLTAYDMLRPAGIVGIVRSLFGKLARHGRRR